MSVQRIYPVQDAFIVPGLVQNTGQDEILELGFCNRDGATGSSRILMQFDPEEIKKAVDGLESFTATLCMFNALSLRLPTRFSISFHKVLESWIEGRGRVTDGSCWTSDISWTNRSKDEIWSEEGGSIEPEPFSVFTASTNLHSTIDIQLDVTQQVKEGQFDSILLKFVEEIEMFEQKTHISFFSSNTHTVFRPYLEIRVDDSFRDSELETVSQEYRIVPTNLQSSYVRGEVVDVRLGVCPRFPSRVFSTSSIYQQPYLLPENSYWGIKDTYTANMLVDFGKGTKISADSLGNFFTLDTNLLPSERYLNIMVQTEIGCHKKITSLNTPFKIKRACQV